MSTELAVSRQDGFSVATSEQSFKALMAFGEQLVKTGFLPAAIKTGAQAASIILTGRELGLPPMTSLRLISIVQGKPTLAAELQLGLFQRRGGRFRWVESTNERATIHLRNPSGDEHTETYTITDAKQAGLTSKDIWQKYPKMMLRARAATGGLRAIDPGNNLYDPDELGDVAPMEGVIDMQGCDVLEATGEVLEVPVEPPKQEAHAQTSTTIKKLVAAFMDKGIQLKTLENYIGRPVEEWQSPEIEIMRTCYKLLKSGEKTVEELFATKVEAEEL